MYDRAPRSLTQPQGSTADHVGPGTYDSSFGKKGKADGYAPFSSMTGRESCIYPTDNVIAAPGPGQYDPREPQNYVKGGSTLQSRARRFVPRISETPGPGAYQVDQDLNLRKAVSAPVFQVQPKEKTGTLVLNRIRFHRKPVAPSIPTPGQAYGYEENDDGSLRKQEPPEKDRSIGPAYYKVANDETVTKEIYHGNFFSKMTSKRMEFGGKDGPGPGDYEAYKQPQTVLEHAHIRNPEKTQFESNVPRYNDQIVHDAERMAIPGPGKYNIRGQFDSRAPVVNTEGIEVEHPPFMSQAKRFHTGKTEAPAPGTYNDPRTALEGLRRVTGLKHSPFGQTSVRFQQQGRTKRTPGPGSYNISGMGSESMRKAYIESTRRGVFGSTAMRIQPMMRQHEVELPGPAHYQIKEKPFKPRFQQPTSNFASLSTRIPEHPLPTKDMPPPGAYDVGKSYEKSQGRTWQAKPRTDSAKKRYGAFQSSASRFAPPRDVVVAEPDPSAPGPGLYNPKLRVHRGNMMINQDKRFKESYAETPGPGTYEFSPLIQDTVLKPTFNASLNNPISARVDYPPGASGAQPFLLGV